MKIPIKKLRTLHRMLFVVVYVLIIFSCSDDNEPQFPITENKPETPIIDLDDKLPVITINTNANIIVDEPKADASMRISELGRNTFDGNIGIEFRGASSQKLC